MEDQIIQKPRYTMLDKFLKFIYDYYAFFLLSVGSAGVILEWWTDRVMISFLFALSYLTTRETRELAKKLGDRIDALVLERYDLNMEINQLKLEMRYLYASRKED